MFVKVNITAKVVGISPIGVQLDSLVEVEDRTIIVATLGVNYASIEIAKVIIRIHLDGLVEVGNLVSKVAFTTVRYASKVVDMCILGA